MLIVRFGLPCCRRSPTGPRPAAWETHVKTATYAWNSAEDQDAETVRLDLDGGAPVEAEF
jgi:hypothetical protein